MDDETTPHTHGDESAFPSWEFPSPAEPGQREDDPPYDAEAGSASDSPSTPDPAPPPPGLDHGGVPTLVLGAEGGPVASLRDDGGSGRPRWGVGRWAVVVVAGLFVLAGAGIGLKLFALRGTGDVLEQMVPANADVYVTAYLDPSLSQKLHLRSLIGKFPALSGPDGVDMRIDDLLRQAFEGSGLDFERDVRPWLGTQLGVVVQVGDGGGAHVALLVASKDDLAAQEALTKLQGGAPEGWITENHDGVEISLGHDAQQGGPLAYAYVDHTAILSDQKDVVEAVIDADRGTRETLSSKPEYTAALQGLPSDRLVLVYVNSGRLLDRFVGEFEGQAGFDPSVLGGGSFGNLKAYRSVGATVSAESDGVEVKVSVSIDSSKLSAEQKRELTAQSHRNVVLDWTSKDAFGLITFSGIGDAARQFVDQASGSDPQAQRSIDELGLTGPNGFVQHLTGDAGIVAGPAPGGKPVPNFALLLASDDRGSAQRFLGNLRDMISGELASGGSQAQWRKETYGSATITWLDEADLRGMGVEPAYAAVDGMTILASSRDAVKDAVDAHAGKGAIGDSPTFKDTVRGADRDSSVIEYFDVEGITAAVVDALDPAARADYEKNAAPNLRPVKAVSFTATGDDDRSTIRLFVLIR